MHRLETLMPLYFFDVQDRDAFIEDDIGFECANREAVRNTALEALPDMARGLDPEGRQHTITVTARDEAGRYVFRASLTMEAGWLEES
ncbi:hypothetical protein VQ042_08200 [Aurantimonas sp. A2-1-M11]|uniref:DUF6894 family protein n=1 Tax=Aurantimonas sp. A2-1-M11 TaxID=3113712 RepID=UPI002F95A1F8